MPGIQQLSLSVAGRFVPQPRDYESDDAHNRGFCRPDAPRRRFGQYGNGSGEIYAQPGCVLVPREWVYFPSRGMKAAVTLANGQASLEREAPMTEADGVALGK